MTSTGTVSWFRSYGKTGVDYWFQVCTSSNDAIYFSDDYFSVNSYVVVGKTDLSGNLVNIVKHEVDSSESMKGIKIDKDGNVIVMSYIDLAPNFKQAISLLKLTRDLQVIDKKAYELVQDEVYSQAFSVLSDGSYLVSGEYLFDGSNPHSSFMIKFQADLDACAEFFYPT